MPSSAVSSILFATFLLLRPCVGSSTSSARDTNENGKNGTAAADAPLLPIPDVLWFAPFFSGGGYCSEAIAFVHALRLNDEVRVGIEQHGDGYSQEFVSGLPASTFNELRQLAATRIRGFGKSHARASHRHSSGGGGGGSRGGAKRESAGVSVAVCHSEPGAWHPSRWPTARCPPAERGFLAVGRTMFETDRLPDGWPARLREMDQIWVPTEFHRDIFARALRAETSSGREGEERGAAAGRSVVDGDEAERKIRVLGEPVDVDFFDPADFAGGVRQPLRIWEAGDSGSGGAAFGRLPTSKNAQGTTEDKLLKASEAAQRPFVFLSVFKWEERKGWDVLLKAFLEEFQEPEDSAASDDRTESKGDIATTTSTTSSSSTSTSERKNNNVVLVILTNAYHSTDGTREFWTQAMKRLGRASPNPGAAGERRGGGGASTIISDSSSSPFHPRVVFHPPGVAQADLPALYAGADAFVLPSRGEGWGRPHVEAMAMGLPVIATNWSGPTEFLTPANGYPLALEEEEGGLVPVREGAFRGHLWANPSVAHLRLLMREVVEDPGAAREKGKRARRDMVEKYSPSVLGNRARRLLVELVQDHERQKRNARERQRSQLSGAEL